MSVRVISDGAPEIHTKAINFLENIMIPKFHKMDKRISEVIPF